MNIFLMTETASGCFKWRSAIPAKYLIRRGHTVQLFSADIQSHIAPDVMVFYRAHFAESVKIVEWCKRNRIRVVFDTDDALDLVPPDNLNYKDLQPRMELYEFQLRSADVVTTTTETLAAHLRRWNQNVTVIPNSVDPEDWSPRRNTGTPRIGWNGSPTHFGDLAVALDGIRDLQKRHDFILVLQGICKESSLDELYETLRSRWGKKFFEAPLGKSIKHFMEKLSGIRYEFSPMVPIERHAQTVCDLKLDIGIAPLIESQFNKNKSCIKYYEYAMAGAVTVASQVLPYSAEVPITAKNNRDSWKYKLEYALDMDREAAWSEQRDWVMKHRNIESTVEQWERAFAGAGHRSEVPQLDPMVAAW
jgi:glycosyltransferase involved in cell wall biosynthesis